MREEIATGGVWARLEPLIPVPDRRFRYPDRKHADDRAAREGVLHVVRTGIGWNRLPKALFGASGATCWRWLTEWREAGVWQQLHEQLLVEVRAAGLLDLSAAAVDATPLSVQGGNTGPSPVDRRKLGCTHHLITDAHGTPLTVTIAGRHHNDVTQLIPLIEAIPPMRGTVGKPRRRPLRLHVDRGYDHDKYRHLVRDHGIIPMTARRGAEHGSGLRTISWPVVRTAAWLKGFRRRRIRTELRADVHQAIISLACSVICLRILILN
ncbi:IS5 family transposase [Amycolatopsis sp. FDAARGOS 1241]|nr:IS5 family transposase [Amycolatopsis sp. FDAARGOS 1241]QRP48149.1 IS5 family transposase [Amycolatopsis sp. FDAARGOS 1241]